MKSVQVVEVEEFDEPSDAASEIEEMPKACQLHVELCAPQNGTCVLTIFQCYILDDSELYNNNFTTNTKEKNIPSSTAVINL